MKKIYKRCKAILYIIFIFFNAIAIFILFSLTNSQEKIHKIRRAWAKLQSKIIPFDVEVVGEIKQADMILMNHQSMLDIIALEKIYPKNIAWIAKKELAQIPIFKICMTKPKLICIDRKNPRDIVRLLKEAKERLDEGRVLAIFPEGTRSRTEKILKFQNGAKILAEKLNLKIQPLLIVDSSRILDSKNFTLGSGTLKIVCLDIIDTRKENWLEETRKQMQDILDKERLKIKEKK